MRSLLSAGRVVPNCLRIEQSMSQSVRTVTFLLTDVQGSTQLWERNPELMRNALVLHDELGQAAIEANGGKLVKSRGEGDSLFSVFESASSALAAAVEFQLALAQTPWQSEAVIKVRMAIHTGTAEFRETDWYGRVVNRCARLRSIGSGGQILVSRVSADLVADRVPEGIELVFGGTHRLKDLEEPEDVFLVSHPDLAECLAPLRSLSSLPNNIPLQLTNFVGRKKELSDLRVLLGDSRLLTLIGSGGAGKTRLSLQLAVEIQEKFPDGVWLVELETVVDASHVLLAVAEALGLREEPGRTVEDVVMAYLRDKRAVLILDNCEHLVPYVKEPCARILEQCPSVTILATSREPIGIKGEQVYRVPSLSSGDPSTIRDPEQAMAIESVELFVERAKLVRPDFELTDSNFRTVLEVARQLDGIPLAIELAAARIKVLSPDQIASKLSDRFRLLTNSDRTAIPRQQTLRATLDWSYDLLTERERRLLNRLSVFSGSFGLDAVENVCSEAELDSFDVLDDLSRLVDRSLVTTASEVAGEQRFRILNSVKEYALESLEQGGELPRLLSKHFDYYCDLALRAEPHLNGEDQQKWILHLSADRDNLNSALAWAVKKGALREACRIGAALVRYWLRRSLFTEGREWLGKILSSPAEVFDEDSYAKALNGLGSLCWKQGNFEEAREWYELALKAWKSLGSDRGIASILNNLGLLEMEAGDFSRAQSLFEESLKIRRRLNERGEIASSLNNLGLLAWNQGDFGAAKQYYGECIELRRAEKDRAGLADAINNLSLVNADEGELEAAEKLAKECLTAYRELGDQFGVASSLHNLGDIEIRKGDFEAASEFIHMADSGFREIGDEWGVAASDARRGDIELHYGRYAQAFEHFCKALTAFFELGNKRLLLECMYGVCLAREGLGHIEEASRLLGIANAHASSEGLESSLFDRYQPRTLQSRLRASDPEFDLHYETGRKESIQAAVAGLPTLLGAV